tara:strand:- start:212 stop:319 length:108 start_codon:yes stop_codon:yes gene_type:complete
VSAPHFFIIIIIIIIIVASEKTRGALSLSLFWRVD